MKFLSTLKLALHTLMQNKLRSLLTIIIIMVVSFVVVVLFGFVFSLQSSMDKNLNTMISEDGVDMQISFHKMVGRDYLSESISLADTEKILDAAMDEQGTLPSVTMNASGGQAYITTSSMSTNTNVQPFYASSNPYVGSDDYLVSGRMWNASDESTNNVFITESFSRSFGLAVGDTVKMSKGYQSDGEEKEYTVQGIIRVSGYYYNDGSVFLDYHHFSDKINNSTSSGGRWGISNINLSMTPQKGELYGSSYKDRVIGIEDAIKNANYENSCDINVSSSLTFQLMMITIMFWVIFGVALFISIIIILLSINSISNTVRISAEQNRKFFGVMKAIGMRNSSVRGILLTQVFIMLIIGVAIATALAFSMTGVLEFLLGALLGSMFGSIEVTVIATISPLVPVITVALLALFVVLFTRSALSSVSRMDVISVINEVA